MPALRHAKKPKKTSFKRLEVNAKYHKDIDTILKGLRSCSQRFGPSETFLKEELRILERLHYKGCNQHRAALFWRKLRDVRRMGSRIAELHLQDLTDSLRNTFYSDETLDKSSKLLKGAWVQVPDITLADYAALRTNEYLQLIKEARERFVSAQMSLSLMMQTGAFLQLILTLTALVARLDCLTADIEENLQDFRLKSLELSRVLSQDDLFMASSQNSTPKGDSPTTPIILEESKELVFVETDDPISVGNAGSSSTSNVEMKDGLNDERHAPTLEQQLSSNISVSSIQLSTTDVEAKIVASELNTQGKGNADPPIKKKKKKRNEIDEIFGFL